MTQAAASEIYQVALECSTWDMSNVAGKISQTVDKEGRERARRASAAKLAAGLKRLPHGFKSEAEWLRAANVNPSFFTALNNGTDPAVNLVRDVLEVAGSSIPEFFLDEARVALGPKPQPLPRSTATEIVRVIAETAAPDRHLDREVEEDLVQALLELFARLAGDPDMKDNLLETRRILRSVETRRGRAS